ncbi:MULTISPECIES: sigma-54-dependent Fis family transcriptional regulator [Bacillaceae]|uniref:sigma-54-dependent Fis family transcriptional regulator n=1 Tax=Bacillaceae TaxID=186817 RepID=UPI0006AE3F16|nr:MULTISPECIES: sigma-54-dependent Fis family transcriptional regulator [Bacillaceae]ALC84628.1 transcriptional regulator [Bacillus sp. FJAT-22090]KQL33453.1 transcriptional regulator [Psychrobacillus sp. FJAT-21963]MDF2064991.1 sigma-54-dependent Fis family transcriptional regulator [Bacillus sp. Cr_A10]
MSEKNEKLFPFYKFAAEQVAIGIHAVDTTGKTVIYNEKMKEIEGLNSVDVEDRSILELFQFEQHESTLLKVLHSGKPVLRVKQTYWNRNGQEITTINDTYPVLDDNELIGAVEFSRDITALERLIYQPLKRYNEQITLSTITAVSPAMQAVLERSIKAAHVRMPVLLIGEAGTGKDLIAEGIHNQLSPANNQFVSLFCHSSDIHLINKFKKELEHISNCTIFCERIDLLSLELQKQLLDILNSNKDGNNLFIASIGEDPVDLIAKDKLNKELYYYFATVTITIPPLRQRTEDILPFMNDYFNRYLNLYGSTINKIEDDVIQAFLTYEWPGNLKELELLLDEISSMITTEQVLKFDMLPLHFKLKVQDFNESSKKAEDFVFTAEKDLLPLEEYLREAERYYLQKALDKYDGNVTKAAEALGMSRQNLQYRRRKMKL